ncbi:MAG: nucleotidyltransferase domain-containing protein [Methanobacteriota archaeon]|nr:MAG: nucleotidyltransferase domain-containing protein [Euryarchaeota archaeon]
MKSSFEVLVRAVYEGLTYFEVFDFVPTIRELHRLVGIAISEADFQASLEKMEGVILKNGYVALRGSSDLLFRRLQRNGISSARITEGRQWGHKLGQLPGVRAVFLTGSVAAGNGSESDDLDFLVVTSPGRLWLVRLILYLAIRLWKPKVDLCLNYLVSASDQAMMMDQNLYVATELAMMVPVYDEGFYRRFMEVNNWRYAYRPNSNPYPFKSTRPTFRKRILDLVLSFPIFGLLDWMEMKRAISRLKRLSWNDEVRVGREVYKGHFSGHRKSTLTRFRAKVQKRFNKNGEFTA